MNDREKDDIFMELANVRTKPTPITVDTEPEKVDTPEGEDEGFGAGEEAEGQLTVDVYQDKDNIVVQSTVAGVEPDELEINITNESVTIRGKREKTQSIEDKDYYYQECFWGRFSRSIILPVEVDPESSKANLKNGILTITMPKLVKKKAKKLKVKLE